LGWQFNSDKPIYLQICDRISRDIISEVYPSGQQLPSVRDLAVRAGVNPNTMQKAMAELEQSGLVTSHRTSGRYVTKDRTMLEKLKHDLISGGVEAFFEAMEHLGIKPSETLALIQNKLESEEA
jgi:DNA-binding transcriptional regulator YhcF (GntR family)